MPDYAMVKKVKSLLLTKGIVLEGLFDEFNVIVDYRKDYECKPMRTQVASIRDTGVVWEVDVDIAPYFWGPEWKSKPLTILFENFASVACFLMDALGSRIDGNNVLNIWEIPSFSCEWLE